MGVPFEALSTHTPRSLCRRDHADVNQSLMRSCLGMPLLSNFVAALPYLTNTAPSMFGFSGAALGKLRAMQNGGKRGRHSVDTWDRQSTSDIRGICDCSLNGVRLMGVRYTVMDRDRRLTGFLRGQTDNPRAPAGFELSNAWKVCRWRLEGGVHGHITDVRIGREGVHLEHEERAIMYTHCNSGTITFPTFQPGQDHRAKMFVPIYCVRPRYTA